MEELIDAAETGDGVSFAASGDRVDLPSARSLFLVSKGRKSLTKMVICVILIEKEGKDEGYS